MEDVWEPAHGSSSSGSGTDDEVVQRTGVPGPFDPQVPDKVV